MAHSKTPAQFAKRMRIVADAVKANTLKAVKRAAIAADQAAVFATPVDTGRARANWLVAIGAPNVVATESTDANAALSQGSIMAQSYKLGQGGIFITNNVPYIGLLDAGSSAQAPAGMTAAAILAARRQLGNATILKGF